MRRGIFFVLTTSNKKRSPRVRIVVLEGYAVFVPEGYALLLHIAHLDEVLRSVILITTRKFRNEFRTPLAAPRILQSAQHSRLHPS